MVALFSSFVCLSLLWRILSWLADSTEKPRRSRWPGSFPVKNFGILVSQLCFVQSWWQYQTTGKIDQQKHCSWAIASNWAKRCKFLTLISPLLLKKKKKNIYFNPISIKVQRWTQNGFFEPFTLNLVSKFKFQAYFWTILSYFSLSATRTHLKPPHAEYNPTM